MELELAEIIRRPVVTEKSAHFGNARNSYTFEVDDRADKGLIKKAIEALYHVHVEAVRTVVVAGKPKRTKAGYKITPSWKKAIVKIHTDEKIEIY